MGAELGALKSACFHAFDQQIKTSKPLTEWDWNQIGGTWLSDYECLQGLALVDTVDGAVKERMGDLPADWNPLVDDPGVGTTHEVRTAEGNQFWCVVPAPTEDPRYRLWLSLSPAPGFLEFLQERRIPLAIIGFLAALLFVLFYVFMGAPKRFLLPVVETLQRSLDRADSPLRIDPNAVPGEFKTLAEKVSLVLEARQREHAERQELKEKDEHYSTAKARYTEMYRSLESLRDHEQTAVQRVQGTLLEINREPVLILDRTRRILMMNEPARKILTLSGQTGSTLRHTQLEEIIETEIREDGRGGPYRLTTFDPYLQTQSTWKVRVSILSDWRDRSQIHCMVVALNQEWSGASAGAGFAPSLLSLLVAAIEKSWSSASRHPCPVSEEETANALRLIRAFVGDPTRAIPCSSVLEVLGVATTSPTSGRVAGPLEAWKAFVIWWSGLASKMGVELGPPRFSVQEDGQVELGWDADRSFRFDPWFLGDEDPVRLFRRELLQQSLQRLGTKLVWHPSDPSRVRLQVAVEEQGRTSATLPA